MTGKAAVLASVLAEWKGFGTERQDLSSNPFLSGPQCSPGKHRGCRARSSFWLDVPSSSDILSLGPTDLAFVVLCFLFSCFLSCSVVQVTDLEVWGCLFCLWAHVRVTWAILAGLELIRRGKNSPHPLGIASGAHDDSHSAKSSLLRFRGTFLSYRSHCHGAFSSF